MMSFIIANIPLSKLREEQKVNGKWIFLILNTSYKLIKPLNVKSKCEKIQYLWISF